MFIKLVNFDRVDLLGEEYDWLDSYGDKYMDVSFFIFVFEVVNGGFDREYEIRVLGFYGDEVGVGFFVVVWFIYIKY